MTARLIGGAGRRPHLPRGRHAGRRCWARASRSWPSWPASSLAAGVVAAGGVRTSLMPYEWPERRRHRAVAGRHHQRVQPARQHGRSGRGRRLRGQPGLPAERMAAGRAVFIVMLLAALHGEPAGLPRLQRAARAAFSLATPAACSSAARWAPLTLLERYVSRASSSLFPVLMPVVVLARAADRHHHGHDGAPEGEAPRLRRRPAAPLAPAGRARPVARARPWPSCTWARSSWAWAR